MPDPVLVLSWLVLAHLVADFVLQADWIAAGKAGHGRRALVALVTHGTIVALCLLPVALAFAGPGVVVVVLAAASHVLVDRLKVRLTRRAEARALAAAHRLHEPPAPAAALGRAWTSAPAGLFVADQAVHVAILWLSWWVLLRDAPVVRGFGEAVAAVTGGDAAAFHRGVLAGVVLAALAIVNVRAGALFVGLLVRPLAPAGSPDGPAAPSPPGPSSPPVAYEVTLGPLHGRLEPEVRSPSPPQRLASPLRVGEAIGVLERLLIVALMLVRAEAAIGLVIAAKTIARFRQLDDREFAEYYLLGTLASVAVAVGSAILAAAALGIPL